MQHKRKTILLLAAQFFFSSGALACVYVTGNTLFLLDFGVGTLPYVYIATGAVVATLSLIVAPLRARKPLAVTSVGTFCIMSLVLFCCWLLLRQADVPWISFFLMLLLPVGLISDAITIGGQIGALFDVRDVKRVYPTVFTGAIVGYITFSWLSPWLTRVLGSADHLLLVAAIAMLMTIALAVLLVRLTGAVLMRKPIISSKQAVDLTTKQLLQGKFTRQLLSYQMLSAIGTQLIIYIFLVQTALRITDEQQLAAFFAQFSGWRNVISIVVALFLASRIISRFGVGISLMLNPIIVGVLTFCMTAIGAFETAGSWLLFAIAIGAYTFDNFLSDTITSTSIKTTYQAIHPTERVSVETLVEGVGVPLAYAVTGVLLLLLNAMEWAPANTVLWVTAFVTIIWSIAGAKTARSYQQSLTALLQRRVLPISELNLDDAASLAVVIEMLESGRALKIQHALQLLDDHPALDLQLLRLVTHSNATIQKQVLAKIEDRQLQAAVPSITKLLAQKTLAPTVRAAALKALCAIQGDAAVTTISDYRDAPDIQVQTAAYVGLSRYTNGTGRNIVQTQLATLMADPNPQQRRQAATIIGESNTQAFLPLLYDLLADDDLSVRHTAFLNAAALPAADIVPLAAQNLGTHQTRSIASQILLAHPAATLALVKENLASATPLDDGRMRRLLSLCAKLPAEDTIATLAPHVLHPKRALRLPIQATLGLQRYRLDEAQANPLLQQEIDRYLALLQLGQRLDATANDGLLQRSLSDERRSVQADILTLLTLLYDYAAIDGVAQGLRKDSSARAVAYESLKTRLRGPLKLQLLTIFDARLTTGQQLKRLEALVDGSIEDPYTILAIQAPKTDRQRWLSSVVNYTKSAASPTPNGDREMLEKMERVAILSTVPLFAETPSYLLASVADIVEQKIIQPDQQFITAGALEMVMYIVVDGQVRVHKNGQTIVRLAEGDTVGELGVLDSEPRSANVSTETLTTLFAIHKEAFDELLSDFPEIARSVIYLLTGRLRRQGAQLAA